MKSKWDRESITCNMTWMELSLLLGLLLWIGLTCWLVLENKQLRKQAARQGVVFSVPSTPAPTNLTIRTK